MFNIISGFFSCLGATVEVFLRRKTGPSYFAFPGIFGVILLVGVYFVDAIGAGSPHPFETIIYIGFVIAVVIALIYQIATVDREQHSLFYGIGPFDNVAKSIFVSRIIIEPVSVMLIALGVVKFLSMKTGIVLSLAAIGIGMRAAISLYTVYARSRDIKDNKIDAQQQFEHQRKKEEKLEPKQDVPVNETAIMSGVVVDRN